MWKDHIVEEVRKVRKEHAAKLNFDIKAIVEDVRNRQSTSKHNVVSFLMNKQKSYNNRLQPAATIINNLQQP